MLTLAGTARGRWAGSSTSCPYARSTWFCRLIQWLTLLGDQGTTAVRRPWTRAIAAAVLVGLCLSAAALAAAPALMPPSYSRISQTTSESAAQGGSGAWLARLSFLLFGLSAMALAFTGTRRRRCTRAARARVRGLAVDVVAVATTVVVPLAMSGWPADDGALQRIMFAVAYVRYATAAVRILCGSATRRNGSPRPGQPDRLTDNVRFAQYVGEGEGRPACPSGRCVGTCGPYLAAAVSRGCKVKLTGRQTPRVCAR